jgi:hypothetical protein
MKYEQRTTEASAFPRRLTQRSFKPIFEIFACTTVFRWVRFVFPPLIFSMTLSRR